MKKLAVIILLFLSGCTFIKDEEIPYVTCTVAHFQDISEAKIYQGFIDRGLDVELSFGLSGIMNEIYVIEGDFVKKGKLLAKLDNDEYKLSISRAKSELNDATVKYNRAKSYYERVSKLHAAGGISYNDWETAQTDLKSASNQIDIARDALKIAENKETFSNIYAPYDGYIIKTYKDEMQFAVAGEKVILFQGRGMPEARIFVSQDDINSLNPGQKVIIRADAVKNKKYEGVIKSKVASSINEGAYRVTVTIADNPPELLDGMSVYMAAKNVQKKGIMLPLDAVSGDAGEKFVYVVENSTAKKRVVNTGMFDGRKIEITKGVAPGELVVVEGVGKIMDGAKVRHD